MKKKIMTLMLVAGLTLIMTGCGKDEEASSPALKSKGNCNVLECIEKLNPTQTLEEMNNIIGFDGELTSETESYKVYKWALNEETSITSQFMLNYNTATISANYPTSIAPHNADFSKWDEIKSKLNNRETITYDEFVNLVGGVQGTIDKKTSSSTSYVWYNKDGGYLSAYFNPETGKCTMATGRF